MVKYPKSEEARKIIEDLAFNYVKAAINRMKLATQSATEKSKLEDIEAEVRKAKEIGKFVDAALDRLGEGDYEAAIALALESKDVQLDYHCPSR